MIETEPYNDGGKERVEKVSKGKRTQAWHFNSLHNKNHVFK